MSQPLQPVRGTKDLLMEDYRLHQHVIDTASKVAQTYGFQGIATPIFEFTDVFKRTLGESSDVVNKEMYTFEDRSDNSITLRPEFTAGLVRAFISNGMEQHLPLKWFSHGPLFRYERPQKGRMRQFHQINLEHIGAKGPENDVAILTMAHDILEKLGVRGKTELHLNSIGDTESRQHYRTALIEYFSKYKNDLSEDSQRRLEQNPLRILDSKDEGDKKLVKDAPTIDAYYNDNTKVFWDGVQQGLTDLGIAYQHNPYLVRGLDYYCDTAFEFITETLGAQGTVLGGGRYNGLVEQMGGKDVPAIGFAAGIERLAAMIEEDTGLKEQIDALCKRPIVIIPEEGLEKEAMKLAHAFRQKGWLINLMLEGDNTGKRMKRASKANAKLVLLLRGSEWSAGKVILKDFDSSIEQEPRLTELDTFLSESYANVCLVE